MKLLLNLIALIVTLPQVSAKLPQFKHHRELSPDDIGLYHTEAFERLAQQYSSHGPKDRNAAMQDMVDIVSSYCSDEECIESSLELANSDFSIGVKKALEDFPEDIEDSIRDHLESIRLSILSLDDDEEVQDVISSLELIQKKLREDKNVEDDAKYLGLAAGSVAIESTKLWTSVHSDAHHPLHSIKRNGYSGRGLQDVEVEVNVDDQTALIILADFVGLVAFLGIPLGAILASLYAFDVLSTRTPSPTPSPTQSPTPSPTQSPTVAPGDR